MGRKGHLWSKSAISRPDPRSGQKSLVPKLKSRVVSQPLWCLAIRPAPQSYLYSFPFFLWLPRVRGCILPCRGCSRAIHFQPRQWLLVLSSAFYHYLFLSLLFRRRRCHGIQRERSPDRLATWHKILKLCYLVNVAGARKRRYGSRLRELGRSRYHAISISIDIFLIKMR